MKILKVKKDERYLYIETNQGTLKQSLKWRGIKTLEEKCNSLIGFEVTHTTLGDWDPNIWFQDVHLVEEEIISKKIASLRPSESVPFNTDLKFENKTVQKIYGPPGTGKTSTLIDSTLKAVSNGVDIGNVGYFAFTNIAANEALTRISKSLGISEFKFTGFSTLHSLATKIGGTLGNGLCNKDHLKEFDPQIGAKEEWMKPGDISSIVVRPIHPVLDAYSLKINKMGDKIEYDEVSHPKAVSKLSQYFNKDEQTIELNVLEYSERYCEAYVEFKKNHNLVDFNDVIVNVVSNNFSNNKVPSFELLIIDEAQDLTKLQWKLVDKLASKSKKTIIAGDDDQAIMEAFGASPRTFNEYPVTEPDIVLDISYRVPADIKSFVDRVLLPPLMSRFKWRKDKNWSENPNAESSGIIVNSFEKISETNLGQVKETKSLTTNQLIRIIAKNPKLDWLIMAPTRKTCNLISAGLEKLEVPHFLHRRDMLGATDTNTKVKIQTVHTSKGMGADNAAYIIKGFADNKMDERDPRLRYVAVTRAKDQIYLVNEP
ncbi:UvrD-helicase domain-containing protein [Planktomarina sp.]|nr:UvrD-helicase domain-containing protein [Planktomarina sp.]